ncbi:MAG: right-handed parallel beta-helix repeat-containing protein [Candidatus Eisenbacteria sp.]|nr:right-handed parallel beta-helix repeat-containing protein [Candidatus Eisenbacteria bacterium]
MKRPATIFLGLVIAGLLLSPTAAEVPRLINYQGILTDTGGQPVDGDHKITFAIYPDSAAGATALWTEEHDPVPVNEGLFNVILGGIEAIPDSVFASASRWMGIKVDDDPETSPRMQITSVPWAFSAAAADSAALVDWDNVAGMPYDFADGVDNVGGSGDGHSLDAADGEPANVVYADTSGHVGIWTTSPEEKFHVAGNAKVDSSFSARTATIDSLLIKHRGAIRYADQFPGDDAGQKIAAAIADLPTEGGIVDARGFSGEQWIQQNIFAGVGKRVTLYLGAATYNIATGQVIDDNLDLGSICVVGQGNSTVLKPTSSMTVFQVTSGDQIRFADMRFDLNGTNSTAIFLRGVLWYGAVLERLWVAGSIGTAPLIRVGVSASTAAAIGAVLRDLWLLGPITADAIDIGCEMVLVDHVSTMFCRAGVRVRASNATSITISNSMFHSGRHALLIDEGDNDTLLFMGNYMEGNSWGHIKLVGLAAHFPIKNVIIRDNYLTQMNSPDMYGIYLKNVKGVVIEGNRFASGFLGSGAESVVFDENVSDVCLAGNIALAMEPTMSGYDSVPLQVNDVTATQSSNSGGFSAGLTVGGILTAKDMMNIRPRLSSPDDPVEGDVYMDATTHKLMVFDGSTWQACW